MHVVLSRELVAFCFCFVFGLVCFSDFDFVDFIHLNVRCPNGLLLPARQSLEGKKKNTKNEGKIRGILQCNQRTSKNKTNKSPEIQGIIISEERDLLLTQPRISVRQRIHKQRCS